MKKALAVLLAFAALGCTQKREFSGAYVPDYCELVLEQNLPLFYENMQAEQKWYDCNSTAQEISRDFQDNALGWALSSKVVSEHLSSIVFYMDFGEYYEILAVSVIPNDSGRRVKVTQAFSETIPETAWT